MNTTSQTRLTVNDYVFLLVAGVLFYLLNRLTPFPWHDDIMYQYIGGMGGGIDGNYEQVRNLKDVITSQLFDYQHSNGRFIVHAIVQCFCALWGMEAFRVVNVCVFLLLCVGMMKILRLQFASRPLDKYLIVFALFFLLPTPGGTFLGIIAYAINYLWTACAVIWVAYLYLNLQRGSITLSVPLKIAVFLGAAIVGSLQESFTIGVSGALFFYYCFNFKKLRGDVAWLVIGFWVGTCFAVFAPANFVRLDKMDSNARFSALVSSLSRFAHAILEAKALPLLIVVLVVYGIRSWNSCWEFIRTQTFWLLGIAINVLFIGLMAYTGARQLTAPDLFSILVLLQLSYHLFAPVLQRRGKVISILAVVLIGMLYVPVYQSRLEEKGVSDEVLKRAEDFKGEIFVNTDCETYMAKCKNRYLPSNYNSFPLSFVGKWGKHVLSCYATRGANIRQIKAVLPQTTDYIIGHCIPEHEIQENVYQLTLSENNYLAVVRIPASVDIAQVEMIAWMEPFKLLGKLRDKVFNLSDNKMKVALNDDEVGIEAQCFVEGGWRYVVFPNIVHKVETTIHDAI